MTYKFPTDLQQIFDTVYRGLAAQDWRAAVGGASGTACQYRGNNGDKCAAGHLIPDEHYDQALEGLGVRNIEFNDWFKEGVDGYDDPLSGYVDVNEDHYSRNSRGLMAALQAAHDYIGAESYSRNEERGRTERKRHVVQVAIAFNLDIPSL